MLHIEEIIPAPNLYLTFVKGTGISFEAILEMFFCVCA